MKNLNKIVLTLLGLALTGSVYAQSSLDFPIETYEKEKSLFSDGEGMLQGKVKQYEEVGYEANLRFGEWEAGDVRYRTIVKLDRNGRKTMSIINGDTTRYEYGADGLLSRVIYKTGISLYKWTMENGKPKERTIFWQDPNPDENEILFKATYNQRGNAIVRDKYKNGNLDSRTKYHYDYTTRECLGIMYDSNGDTKLMVKTKYQGNTKKVTVEDPTKPGMINTVTTTGTFDANRNLTKVTATYMGKTGFVDWQYKYDSRRNVVSAVRIKTDIDGTKTAKLFKVKYEYYE